MTVLVYLKSGQIEVIENVRDIENGIYDPITVRTRDWSERTFECRDIAKMEVMP